MICCAILIFGFRTESAAQDSGAAGKDTIKVEKVISPIELTDVGTETEQTLKLVRTIRDQLVQDNTELEIDSIAPIKMVELAEAKKILKLEEISRLPVKQIESLKSDFLLN